MASDGLGLLLSGMEAGCWGWKSQAADLRHVSSPSVTSQGAEIHNFSFQHTLLWKKNIASQKSEEWMFFSLGVHSDRPTTVGACRQNEVFGIVCGAFKRREEAAGRRRGHFPEAQTEVAL